MKALSIRQPWAWLIANGYKDIENRKWKTNYRGIFLIHAGKTFDHQAYERIKSQSDIPMPGIRHFGTGGIVGSAEITGCVEAHSSPWFSGPYGFLVERGLPIPFISCTGRLNFFSTPPGLLHNLAGTVIKYNQETRMALVRLFHDLCVGERIEVQRIKHTATWTQPVRRMARNSTPVTMAFAEETIWLGLIQPAGKGDQVYLLREERISPPPPPPDPEPDIPNPDGPIPDIPAPDPDDPGPDIPIPDGPEPPPDIFDDIPLPNPISFPSEPDKPGGKGHGTGG